MEKTLRLLYVAQKINDDDELAFVSQWVEAFQNVGYDVTVICFERGTFDDRFKVVSLGKEKGAGKLLMLFRFWKFIFTNKFDRVFVHMIPEFFTMGGWWWKIQGVPSYMWYTHYALHIHIKLASVFSKRMFAATKQSMPQFDSNPKKIVTGHGVDVDYWYTKNQCADEKNLLMVHRVSRSKRIELGIKALSLLPHDYKLTIYGRLIDDEYYQELLKLTSNLSLQDRVFFKGSVPASILRTVYPQYRIMINMASETIDKTMLEAMCNGVFPVTTKGNLEAIGLTGINIEDLPESIASLIAGNTVQAYPQDVLVDLVKQKHSLSKLVKKMNIYIAEGN